MEPRRSDILSKVFPACRSAIGPHAWDRLLAICGSEATPESFPDELVRQQHSHVIPDFLPELARLEWTRHAVSQTPAPGEWEGDGFQINPTLEVLRLSWRLCRLLGPGESVTGAPQPGEEYALVWRDPGNGATRVQDACKADLLVLKMLTDDAPLEEAAARADLSAAKVERACRQAAEKGILLAPRSKIRRDLARFPASSDIAEEIVRSESFLIQWHITHACDLHCKHCYDRSKRSALSPEQGLRILDDLRVFCRNRRVRGHVCFTGGNPFLHPHFFDLYRAAAERGFSTSVLGNPVPRSQVETLLAIQELQHFQVSLEGLPAHNDLMRGTGHFSRTIEFLGVLRDLRVPSTVMLTLTRDNMDQVLPLAERLRGHTGYFNFNRLSQVGEGAGLALPGREEYAAFLRSYVDAAEANPILGFKDNLINVVLRGRNRRPFGGCTGHGCGAAFNFVAVLPDGEVHACRKFPSPIGNVLRQTLDEIYDSAIAKRYRTGCSACAPCPLRLACGGCMAIAHGRGLNPFEDRDPYCFLDAPA